MKFRNSFTETDNHPSGIECEPGSSKTKQSEMQGCDIHYIIDRGLVPPAPPAMYGDFSSPLEFREAMELVNNAQLQFSTLPAKLRDRFGNSPEAFLAFAGDPANMQEMVKLGLAVAKKPDTPPAPQEVVVVEDKRPPKKPTAGNPDGGSKP